MPPHTNRDLAFAGVSLRLGRLASAAPACRLAVLDALSCVPGGCGTVVTVDQVRDCLINKGNNYPRNTVYKTMLRMSATTDGLERADGGFRIHADRVLPPPRDR